MPTYLIEIGLWMVLALSLIVTYSFFSVKIRMTVNAKRGDFNEVGSLACHGHSFGEEGEVKPESQRSLAWYTLMATIRR